MRRRFVMGDIHGAYKALIQCLERARFSYAEDQLIALGDVSDGWPDVKRCVDELLNIKNLVYILGNHDLWTRNWMNSGETTPMWLAQGGEATIKSYEEGVPEAHKKFFRQAHLYYELENKFFVHAGILPHSPLDEQNESIFLWDRSLANMAMDAERKSLKKQFTDYKEIYIGHTPAHKLPYKACNVWLMDTGAAWDGCLSMMDIDSKEVFSSDPVPGLYPDSIGRLRL